MWLSWVGPVFEVRVTVTLLQSGLEKHLLCWEAPWLWCAWTTAQGNNIQGREGTMNSRKIKGIYGRLEFVSIRIAVMSYCTVSTYKQVSMEKPNQCVNTDNTPFIASIIFSGLGSSKKWLCS